MAVAGRAEDHRERYPPASMPPFTIDAGIAAEPSAVFKALTTPARLERWLYATESISEVSGSLEVPGTTFVQRAMKGIQRPGGVVASDPPRHWHIRLAGFGERAELAFELEPAGSGTHLRLTVDVRNGPRLIGPIVDRLSIGLERRLWRGVLSRIREEMAQDAIMPIPGGIYVVEGGGWPRIAQVIDADDAHVHLELWPGMCDSRPTTMSEIELPPRRLRDHFDLRPLEPSLRSAMATHPIGSRAMLADGGFGLPHCPMTLIEFRNARPRMIGEAAVEPAAEARVRWWRQRGGAAFGEPRPPVVGAFLSVALQAMGVDAIGFGVVKLLRQELRGVHLRVYSTTFEERPARVEEPELSSMPADPASRATRPPSAPMAVGHLPLRHASFSSWQPQLVATALVHPDELLGYGEWKLARGGFL